MEEWFTLMRTTWNDNVTSLRIGFYTKDENKSQVVVQHQKIPDSKMATRMKEFPGEKLALLKEKPER